RECGGTAQPFSGAVAGGWIARLHGALGSLPWRRRCSLDDAGCVALIAAFRAGVEQGRCIMTMLQSIFVKPLERALVYRDGRAVELLRPGRYWRFALRGGLTVTKLSVAEPWIALRDLALVAKTGVLAGEAIVLDLGDRERAIVRIDGRYAAVVGKG